MKYPITILATLLTIVPIAATAQTDPPTGKEIFEQMCAGCHGTGEMEAKGTEAGSAPVSARSPTRNT